MKNKDLYARTYLGQPEIFADAFNAALFDGKPLIKPENLTPVRLAHHKSDEKGLLHEFRRDLLMSMTIMRHGSSLLTLLGLEHQTAVDYSMVLRCLNYDVSNWMEQRQQTMSRNMEKARQTGTPISPLEAYRQQDRLTQVVTIVVYLGQKPWDAPTNLREMFAPGPEEFAEFLPDYKIRVLTPDAYGDDWNEWKLHFETELGKVIYYSRKARDRNELLKYAGSDNDIMKPQTIRMLCETLDVNIEPKEEITTMCQAIQELKQEWRLQGRAEGREEGRAEGRVDGNRESIIKMIGYMRKMHFPESEIIAFIIGAHGLTAEQAMALLATGA